jgi:hypothetical protein
LQLYSSTREAALANGPDFDACTGTPARDLALREGDFALGIAGFSVRLAV